MNTDLLKGFGLTQNEIDIFVSLIRKGSLSATEIAKETGLNRPYVYYALERLLEKGYLSQETAKGKRRFRAVDLKSIMFSESEKLKDLDSLFSQLERLRQTTDDSVSVEVLKGKLAVRNALKKALSEVRPGSEVLTMGVDESRMEELEPVYLKKMISQMKQKRISERAIIKEGSAKLSYAKTTRYRFLPGAVMGNTARVVYNDSVVEIIYGATNYVIVTDNALVADAARKQFTIIWNSARK